MSTTPRSAPRNPWLLPVLLALLVAVIVLAVLLGPKISSALNQATSTPVVKKEVVTATAGTTTPVPTSNPAILPSATPSTNQGVVTPLPHTTPVSTIVGLQLDMFTYPANFVTSTQAAADRGDARYSFYLDPRKVVQLDLPHFGFTQGFSIVSPAPAPTPTPATSADGRPVIKFVVQYQSQVYTVFVTQPGTRGPKGIWLIVTALQGRQ